MLASFWEVSSDWGLFACSILFIFQTVIDGFDPDKFRKVNKNGLEDGTGGLPLAAKAPALPRPPEQSFQRQPIPQQPFQHSQVDVAVVPTYDRTEQQLLQTLEQELGVL